MICPKCKAMLADNANICNRCGMVFNVQANSSYIPNQTNYSNGQQGNNMGMGVSNNPNPYNQQQNPNMDSGSLYGQYPNMQQNPYIQQNSSIGSGNLYQNTGYGQSTPPVFTLPQTQNINNNGGHSTGYWEKGRWIPYFPNNKRKKIKQKDNSGCLPGIIVLIVLIGFIIWIANSSSDEEDTAVVESTTEEMIEETTAESVAANDDSETFDVDLSEYNYITGEELAKYAPNLVDQKVYFVATVGQVDDDKIQVNIGDGYMYTNCNTISSYVGKVNEEDKVVICGQVVGQDTYGFLGNSNEL